MQTSAKNELPFKCYPLFLHPTVAWQLCGAGLALPSRASGLTVLGKELPGVAQKVPSGAQEGSLPARLSQLLGAVLGHCHCLSCSRGWTDAVGQCLQVTPILHPYRTPGHECLVVWAGIASVNRVSLISERASAESSLPHSLLRETPLIDFSSRLLCTCPLSGSSAPLPQLAHEYHYSDEAFDALKKQGIFSSAFVPG